jgi:hypothetical protein
MVRVPVSVKLQVPVSVKSIPKHFVYLVLSTSCFSENSEVNNKMFVDT